MNDALDKKKIGRWAIAVGLVTLALAMPPFMPSFYLHIIILMIIFAVFAMSLDILMGYAGLPSMGHAAFFGFAAYCSGLLCARYGGTWWQGLALGLSASAVLAALFGFVALRARGLYFLLITLALGQVLWGAANRWGSLTGGYNGLRGIPQYLQIFGTTLGAYYGVLVAASCITVIMFRLVRSPFGLSLQGLRDSETRMRALGYNVWLHKYIAFIFSAVFAAAAGVMSAYYKGFVSPFDLSLAVSADVVLMVILGGTGTLIGPVIGAMIIVALRNFLSIFINHWLIALGLIFILTVFVAPRGVVRWFSLGSHKAPEDEGEPGDFDSQLIARFVHETAASRSISQRSGSVADVALNSVSKLFGGMRAVDNISLEIFPGERVVILGPNGAGKTSLFHLVSGSIRPTEGQIYMFGQDVSRLSWERRVRLGIGRTFQITKSFSNANSSR